MTYDVKDKQESLFDMTNFKSTPIKAARAKRVRELKVKYKIYTHHSSSEKDWMALSMNECVECLKGYDLTEDERTDGFYLMAGYCRLLDESGLISFGKTELKAILDLVERLKNK